MLFLSYFGPTESRWVEPTQSRLANFRLAKNIFKSGKCWPIVSMFTEKACSTMSRGYLNRNLLWHALVVNGSWPKVVEVLLIHIFENLHNNKRMYKYKSFLRKALKLIYIIDNNNWYIVDNNNWSCVTNEPQRHLQCVIRTIPWLPISAT